MSLHRASASAQCLWKHPSSQKPSPWGTYSLRTAGLTRWQGNWSSSVQCVWVTVPLLQAAGQEVEPTQGEAFWSWRVLRQNMGKCDHLLKSYSLMPFGLFPARSMRQAKLHLEHIGSTFCIWCKHIQSYCYQAGNQYVLLASTTEAWITKVPLVGLLSPLPCSNCFFTRCSAISRPRV